MPWRLPSLGLRVSQTIAQEGLGFFPPQVSAVSVTLALIALAAERLQVVRGITPTLGAWQDMELQSLQFIPSGPAPVVMFWDSGLLFNDIQEKNLHSADRMRAPMIEDQSPGSALRSSEP